MEEKSEITNSIKDTLSELGIEMDDQGRAILYHVTTTPNLCKILEDGSILPGNDTGQTVWRVEGDEKEVGDSVYLAKDIERARGISKSIQTKNDSSTVILEVHVNPDVLVADGDSQATDFIESIKKLGTCASSQSIPIKDVKMLERTQVELTLATREEFLSREENAVNDKEKKVIRLEYILLKKKIEEEETQALENMLKKNQNIGTNLT